MDTLKDSKGGWLTLDEFFSSMSVSQIVEARKRQGLTQAQLGKLVGLPQSYISRIEKHPERSSVALIVAIAAALGVKIVLDPTEAFWKAKRKAVKKRTA